MGCCSSQTKNSHIKGKDQPLNQPVNTPGIKVTTITTSVPRLLHGQRPQDDNLRIDTPIMTEEGKQQANFEGEAGATKSQVQFVNGIGPGGKAKTYQYFDISPKVIKKNKIYHVSNKFPVTRPYSNPSEWQKLFVSSQVYMSQGDQQQLEPAYNEDTMVKAILGFRNRNWIQEQIKVQTEMSTQNTGSFDSLVVYRSWIQLKEHFNWLVYSVAQLYFYQKFENTYKLPKFNTRMWTDGFEYKGVYFRVLPYEEAYFIQNEMQALKYVQMELLELGALAPKIREQQQIKDKLQKDVVLPLLFGVSCGGFYLYGTPVIYTQELDPTKDFFKNNDTINNSKLGGLHNSVIQNYNSVQQMQAIVNQSNLSYSYLHNNINAEFIQESMFKFMPILKNITTKNMIPMIDFEEFNERQNEEQKFDIDLKYLLVNLFDILPRLSETGASTLLMKYPCQQNEEITYQAFPKNNYMEVEELKKLISTDTGHEGDIEEDDNKDISNIFTKKFFTKHGWDFIIMQRVGAIVENKKASSFYNQRELGLKSNKDLLGGGQPNMLFIDDYDPQEEGKNQQEKLQFSPQKQTILRRNDSLQEDRVYGNALVAAYNYKKDFKVKYSMINHTYSSDIESLFSVSIEQVVKIIEQSDNLYNSNSLKELIHRKGLNMRFLWIILSKLRINFYRDMIMIEILLRVMRKIINEEIKIKSKVQNAHQEGGIPVIEEYYQGFQLDVYKDVLQFYMNAILKRKFTKHKQVFDETLLGLFLSRMSILGILFSISLKKEEYIYLESKDILEDIIEAPSRNPVLFINAVQSYFKIDFQPEFLRVCRQDKHLLLSKNQPVTINDMNSIQLKNYTYFSIKEYVYFLLASQITKTQVDSARRGPAKIKTKTEKDVLKQSFQKPTGARPSDSGILNSQTSQRGGIGPMGINNNDSSTADHDSKTVRNNENAIYKDTQNTIRQYHNMDRGDELLSPPLKEAKRNRIEGSSQPSGKKTDIIDLSKLSKRSSFVPQAVQELILPSCLYKLRTYLHSNSKYIFDQSSKTYVGDTMTVLRSYYPMPSLDIINGWVIYIESLMKDVYAVNCSEQVLIEAFLYQAIQVFFFESNQASVINIFFKIRESIFRSAYIAPEIITFTHVLFGLAIEAFQNDDESVEWSYMSALKSLIYLYGDPRGRGNLGVPYMLMLSWKLSLTALVEDQKLHDSEFAEELFDGSLAALWNHRRFYKDQQLASSKSSKQLQTDSFQAQEQTPFEKQIERSEMYKLIFDIKKYRARTQNLTVASGINKSNTIHQRKSNNANQASMVYASHNPSMNSHIKAPQTSTLQVNQPQPKDILKSQSHVVINSKMTKKNDQKEYDIDVSDIDLDVEDENKNYFIEENFKNQEWSIGICPFPHWSLYRQQLTQKLQSSSLGLNRQESSQQALCQQFCRDIMAKPLNQNKDIYYRWLIKFNPMMYQCGIQCNSSKIRELFAESNLISSGSSSVVQSNVGGSQDQLSRYQSSMVSSQNSSKTNSKKRKKQQSYFQQLGKEHGGISKSDMSGVIFAWGTDSCGQIGQDSLINNQNGTSNIRVLCPRMVVQLRDEIIKEICCGHSHTLAITINGQVYGWGLNENAQLGLGNDAPPQVRKPVLNPYLTNVMKLSAGIEHSLALTKNGELYTWGAGGLTGTGDHVKKSIPVKLDFFSKQKVQYAICGGLHTIAVTKEGEIYSWGSTEGGQLGLSQQTLNTLTQGKEIPVLSPQKIPALIGHQVTQVACGEAHTIIMTKDNKLFGWGMSNYGQLGLGFSSDTFEPGTGMEKSKVYEPQEITAIKHEKIQKIVTGATFTLFLTEKGELYGCGLNDLGQLGLDTHMEDIQMATSLDKAKRGKFHHHSSDVTVPKKVICFQGFELNNIACGENHALAIVGADRSMIWAWGMYRNGQLGLGEVLQKMNPRPVQTLSSTVIQRIACGSMHSLALIGDSQSISTFSAQYYANNDILQNQWQCDIRPLSLKENYIEEGLLAQIENELPDDGEGRIKNPK